MTHTWIVSMFSSWCWTKGIELKVQNIVSSNDNDIYVLCICIYILYGADSHSYGLASIAGSHKVEVFAFSNYLKNKDAHTTHGHLERNSVLKIDDGGYDYGDEWTWTAFAILAMFTTNTNIRGAVTLWKNETYFFSARSKIWRQPPGTVFRKYHECVSEFIRIQIIQSFILLRFYRSLRDKISFRILELLDSILHHIPIEILSTKSADISTYY